ncbi:MAG: Serine/threonine protein kinase-related protein [Verrucomicrobia bacterium]|nr:Serine/threonine protein kinase-related protein [Verrucomicrobiota bacterium]
MATFHLVIEPPSGGRYEHRLALGSYVLGREQGACDVAIVSPEISRRHVRLTFSETQCTVEDLGSTSGTYHSGLSVRESRALAYPLELHLGTVRLHITLAKESAGDTNGSGVAGHYTKGAEIAKGGMGAVLEANDQLLGRTVAMKVVRHDIGDSESIRLRFIREATVLARLEHPSIVPIYEMGRDAEGRLYYTMKKVEGRTLQAILDDLKAEKAATVKEFTLDRLLNIYRKICEAMAFAHAKGVIHRDLKPENVMVGAYGEVLVMDWGLAKVLYDVAQTAQEMQLLSAADSAAVNPKDGTLPTGFAELSDSQLRGSSQNLTVDGSVMGSPQYMPPEQAEGKVGDLDERADVFSLGGILYATLTLKPPVEGRTVKEVLDKVKSGNIVPPTHFNIGSTSAAGMKLPAGTVTDPKQITPLPHCPGGRVPGTLSAITMKALAFDREQRYGSVGELLADVEAYQRGFATSAEDVNLLGQLALFMKRHRGITVSVVVALLLIAVLTGGFVWRIGEEKIEALAQADRATEEAAKAKVAEQTARRAEGKAVQEFGKAQIALAEAAFRSQDLEGMVKALEDCPPERRDQTWEYLSAKRDFSLRALAVSGRPYRAVQKVIALPGKSGVFAVVVQLSGIDLVDVTTDRIAQTIETGVNGPKAVAVSGDGKLMVVAAKEGDTVMVFDLGSGRKVKTLPLPLPEKGQKKRVNDLILSHDGRRLAVNRPMENSYIELRMIDLETGNSLWSQREDNGRITFDRSGTLLSMVTAGRSRFSRLLNVADGKVKSSLALNATSHAFSPNGKWLAVGAADGSVYIMDAQTGEVRQRGRLYSGQLEQMAWTVDNRLLTMGDDGRFRSTNLVYRWRLALWRAEDLQPLGTFHGLPTHNGLDWSLAPETGYLLTAQSPPRLWRVPVGLEAIRKTHAAEQGWSCAFISDTLLLGRKEFMLVCNDLSNPADIVEVPGGSLHGHTLGASHWPSGMFATAMRTKTSPLELKLFSSNGKAIVQRWSKTIQDRGSQLEFDQAGERLLLIYLSNPNVEVLSTKAGESLLRIPKKMESGVFAGKAGNIIGLIAAKRSATGAADELWQLDGQTGKPLQTNTFDFRGSCLVASPDRSLVAVGGADQMVHIFEAETLKEKFSFRVHDDEVTAVAFHPGRPVIATASMDGSVKLWDYTTKKMVNYFIGLEGTPVCLAFSPNGKWLAVEGQEHTSRVYDVSRDMPMAVAK